MTGVEAMSGGSVTNPVISSLDKSSLLFAATGLIGCNEAEPAEGLSHGMFELPVPTNKCRIGLVEMDETSDACVSGAGEGAV